MVQPRKPAVRLVKAPVPDYVLRVELKYIKPAIHETNPVDKVTPLRDEEITESIHGD